MDDLRFRESAGMGVGFVNRLPDDDLGIAEAVQSRVDCVAPHVWSVLFVVYLYAMNNLEKFVRLGEIAEEAVTAQTAHRQSVQVTILTVSATLLALTATLYNGEADTPRTAVALKCALVSGLVSMLSSVFFLLGLTVIHKRFVDKILAERDRLKAMIERDRVVASAPVAVDETLSQPQGSICEVAEYISCVAAMIELLSLFAVAYFKFFVAE